MHSEASIEAYTRLWIEATRANYSSFLQALAAAFPGTDPPLDWINQLALTTQICIKRSRPLFIHGYLLYCALRHYCATHPQETRLTILESGTSRGFSALCMAKALDDAGVCGTIYTFDINLVIEKGYNQDGTVAEPTTDYTTKRIYWNCIADMSGPKTRYELIAPWADLAHKYITFIEDDIYKRLPHFLRDQNITRVHFAFLDAKHTYDALSYELATVYMLQCPGDVIVCDDYTVGQFQGVVQAIDEHTTKHTDALDVTKFFHQHGTSGEYMRGYVYMRRRSGQNS